VQGCGPSAGQTLTFVGGTSAAAPLVAGMIALWNPEGPAVARAPAGLRPAAAVLARPARRVPGRHNIVFAGVSCWSAGAGFDLASSLGSPLADQIAAQLEP
jgi:hypothetical protein